MGSRLTSSLLWSRLTACLNLLISARFRLLSWRLPEVLDGKLIGKPQEKQRKHVIEAQTHEISHEIFELMIFFDKLSW